MEPATKDRIARWLGYLLGAVVAGLTIFWFCFKIWNFAALFR